MLHRSLLLALLGFVAFAARPAGAQALRPDEISDLNSRIRGGRLLEAQQLLLGRLSRLTSGEPGTRWRKLGPAPDMARQIGDHQVISTFDRVLADDAAALVREALVAGPEARRRGAAQALACLRRLSEPRPEDLYQRGWCLAELGEPAAARAELEQAVALAPQDADAVRLLARMRWRLGDRHAALELAAAGVERAPSHEGVELLANMLRYMGRKGQADRALALAQQFADRVGSAEAASPLHVLMSEIRLSRDDLPGAVDELGRVAPADASWLIGGVVRQARARAARGESTSVEAALARFPVDRPNPPAALLKLRGDLAMQRQDPRGALRAYAAAVSGGESESAELAQRAHDRSASPLEAGSMAQLLAGRVFADMTTQSPAADLAVGPGQLLPDSPSEELPAPVQRQIDVMTMRDAATRAHAAAEILHRTDVSHAYAVNLVTRLASHVPARADLVRRYIDGDKQGVRASLDAFSLLSWQVVNRGALGMARALPPGGAANPAPLADGQSVPAALEKVGEALRALNDPQIQEEHRLAALMEVAGQQTAETARRVDPIAIDLDGNGQIDLTSETSREGCAHFDLDGWGRAADVQWLRCGHDGWLCEDANHDGAIDSGRELFGTAGGWSDGFEKLAQRDRNGDGVISGDELKGLCIWRETSNPGVVDPGELIPIEQAGVTAISIPRVGLRTTAIVNGVPRLCAEVWPAAVNGRFAATELDLEGI